MRKSVRKKSYKIKKSNNRKKLSKKFKKKSKSIKIKNKSIKRKHFFNGGIKIDYKHIFNLKKGTQLYRVHSIDEDIPIDITSWYFLANNKSDYLKSLWKLKMYKDTLTSSKIPFEYLVVDSFYLSNDITLYELTEEPGKSYVDFENSIISKDSTYKRGYTSEKNGNNFIPAKWLQKNEKTHYGWIDITFPDVLLEVMLIPRAYDYLIFIESKTLKEVFDENL